MKSLSGLAAVALLTYFSSGRGPDTSPRPRPVSSGPVVEERVEYYEVSGSSARELKLAMNVLGPKGASGHPPLWSYPATTTWDVRWRTHYSMSEGRCAIKSFSTSVQILMVLPKWPGRVAGSPLAEAWDRVVQDISVHERGHAEHGILAAKAIQDRVLTLEPASTCRSLEDSIKSTSQALIAKYRAEDDEYDRVAKGLAFETEDDNRAAWIASRGVMPLQRIPPTVPDSELTDTERKRASGTAEFETDMVQLSAKADRADVAWRRYVEDCRLEGTSVSAGAVGGTRGWFGYAGGSANSPRGTKTCKAAETFHALVDQVRDGMCVAEERARTASVYPGVRRELRTKYRLEWDGWDRICRQRRS